jgi:GYF domain 2
MTGQQPDIQWYIARDGKQHGPLSDVEMRTFVSQGHLKPTDLIWRPGFSDWRPAPAVFPFPSPEAAPGPTAPRGPMTRPGGGPSTGPGHAQQNPSQGRPAPTPAPASEVRSFEPDRIRAAQGGDDSRPSGMKRALGVALLLLLLAGGGVWYYLQSEPGQQTSVATIKAPDGSASRSAAPDQTAALMPSDGSPGAMNAGMQELDAKFQQTPMWNVVKREFPDWYSEQLKEAAKLSADNQPQLAVTKHLAEALVQLRRKHADDALAASTPKLKEVANAFLANLKSLSEKSVTACYGFISQGETAPVVLELLQSPDQSTSIQTQIAAIFEAIADGRKTPTTHERAVKSDYEVLVQQLSKLGWQEKDLKTFSNPTALSREPPERVCKMVQDWFVAHLSVPDQATQERLLVETLKPVVSG